MLKTFFKYAKKRWWTLLIFIFSIPFSIACAWITVLWLSITNDGSSPLLPYFVVCIISSIVLILLISMPWLIITIPAACEIGRERKKSSCKYLIVYQFIVLGIIALLSVYPHFKFLILNFSY